MKCKAKLKDSEAWDEEKPHGYKRFNCSCNKLIYSLTATVRIL